MEFLTLSEEYANKYLLDISAEIQRQSSFLDKLEERLEAARKIRREAVDLQLLYESGTTATMENLRATGKAAYYRLRRKNIDTFDFQHFRGHFQRTTPCSGRWTWC
jgi:excinuclease UvrABC helicase subunit UvrB